MDLLSEVDDVDCRLTEAEWKYNPYFKSIFPNYIGNTYTDSDILEPIGPSEVLAPAEKT